MQRPLSRRPDPADRPFTEESKLENAQAGFHRLKIGKIDVTALSDGSAGFFVLNVLAPAKRAEAENLMAKSWVKQPIDASVNAFLIKLPGRTVLVDAGTASRTGISGRPVLLHLANLGERPWLRHMG